MKKNYTDADFFQENETTHAYFSVPERSVDYHTQSFWELSHAYEGAGTFYDDTAYALKTGTSYDNTAYALKTGTFSGSISDSETETLGSREVSIQNGSFLLISPGASHAIASQPKESGSPLRMVNGIFTKKYLDSILEDYKNIPGIENFAFYRKLLSHKPFAILLRDDNAQNLLHLLWLIAHEYNHFTVGSEAVIRNSLLSLLVCITRLYDYQSGQSLPMVSERFDIDELLKYISINYGSKLSLDLLAANMHLSREYLCRYFKKYTGKTIFDYIREVRIAQAKHLLRTSSHTVADIGIFCGYPSVSSFQRAFKAEEGISPGEFREKNKSNTI